jgi:hypothetical protein
MRPTLALPEGRGFRQSGILFLTKGDRMGFLWLILFKILVIHLF